MRVKDKEENGMRAGERTRLYRCWAADQSEILSSSRIYILRGEKERSCFCSSRSEAKSENRTLLHFSLSSTSTISFLFRSSCFLLFLPALSFLPEPPFILLCVTQNFRKEVKQGERTGRRVRSSMLFSSSMNSKDVSLLSFYFQLIHTLCKRL